MADFSCEMQLMLGNIQVVQIHWQLKSLKFFFFLNKSQQIPPSFSTTSACYFCKCTYLEVLMTMRNAFLALENGETSEQAECDAGQGHN